VTASARIDPAETKPRRRRPGVDLVVGTETYRAPFRVVSDDSADKALLARLSPGLYPDVRGAGGVALDLGRRVLGALAVLDTTGREVPRAAWMPALVAARRAK